MTTSDQPPVRNSNVIDVAESCAVEPDLGEDSVSVLMEAMNRLRDQALAEFLAMGRTTGPVRFGIAMRVEVGE